MKPRLRLLAALAAGCLAAGSAQATSYRMTVLNFYYPYTIAVDDQGEILMNQVGRTGTGTGIWSNGNLRILTLEGQGDAMNAHGDAVGYIDKWAAVWPAAGGQAKIPTPNPKRESNGDAINDAGEVVGDYFKAGLDQRCFAWQQGQGTHDLGALEAHGICHPYALSDSGLVGAMLETGGVNVPGRFENGRFTALPLYPGTSSCMPISIADDGDMVGNCVVLATQEHPVLWRGDELVDLYPGPGFVDGVVIGITAAGDIVGNLATVPGYGRSSVEYLPGAGAVALQSLVQDPGDWQVYFANAVSRGGVILAQAQNMVSFDISLVLLTPVD